jgi:integrase
MSIRKRGNSWEVRFRDGRGKTPSKAFPTKKEASAYEAKIKLELQSGTYVDAVKGKVKLADLFHEYMGGKRNLKPKSVESINSLWRHQIEPYLGHMQIQKLNKAVLKSWALDAVDPESGFTSEIRILKALDELGRVLDFAVDSGYLQNNNLRKSNGKLTRFGIEKPRQKHLAIAFTQDQLQEIAKHHGEYSTLFWVMALCGLRWGEVAGLQVKDILPDGSRIVVCRSISEVCGGFHELPTKTNSTRTVPVPASLQESLLLHCIGKNESDLVFSSKNGSPISISNYRNRIYLPALEKSGIEKRRIHDLRATCVSLLISKGIKNILVISRMVGHSDSSVTLRHYAHLFPEDWESISDVMDSVFEPKPASLDFSEIMTPR